MSNLKNFLFTSESVSEGHPDKVSDRISDMVVDTYLSYDPYSRVACETLTTTNKVVLAGEVRGPEINKDELISKVRNCIKDIGYDQEGFTWKEATKIESHLHSQSADIAMGVDSSGNKDEGAGDQGGPGGPGDFGPGGPGGPGTRFCGPRGRVNLSAAVACHVVYYHCTRTTMTTSALVSSLPPVQLLTVLELSYQERSRNQ